MKRIRLTVGPHSVEARHYDDDEALVGRAIAEVAAFTAEDAAPFDAADGAVQTSVHHVLAAVTSTTIALCGEGVGEAIESLILTTTARSVVGIGRENRVLTSLLWDDGDSRPPTRRVPGYIAAETRRWSGVGGWLIHQLCREWIDQRGRAPLGLPMQQDTGDYPVDEGLWASIGTRRTHCPMLVPAGAVMAQLQPTWARELMLPAWTPVLAG